MTGFEPAGLCVPNAALYQAELHPVVPCVVIDGLEPPASGPPDQRSDQAELYPETAIGQTCVLAVGQQALVQPRFPAIRLAPAEGFEPPTFGSVDRRCFPLSYAGMAPLTGVEPASSWFVAKCSSPLSYRGMESRSHPRVRARPSGKPSPRCFIPNTSGPTVPPEGFEPPASSLSERCSNQIELQRHGRW